MTGDSFPQKSYEVAAAGLHQQALAHFGQAYLTVLGMIPAGTITRTIADRFPDLTKDNRIWLLNLEHAVRGRAGPSMNPLDDMPDDTDNMEVGFDEQ